MALVFVNEYVRCARDGSGNPLPHGEEPAIARYTVAITAGSVAGPTINAKTRFLGIHTDAICSITVDAVTAGPTDPVAVATKDRLAANERIFRGVDATMVGQLLGMKLAAITNT